MALKFTLTYDGQLQTAKKPVRRRLVREQLAPQLEDLWQYRSLADIADRALDPTGDLSFVSEVGDVPFVSVIHDKLLLRAELDVLMLSREENHVNAMSRGDIDNRMKSLLDGLRRPQTSQELGGLTARPDGKPFHCLLDDDKLVTRVGINSGRLLGPRDDPDAVLVLIQVTVESAAPTHGSVLLGI